MILDAKEIVHRSMNGVILLGVESLGEERGGQCFCSIWLAHSFIISLRFSSASPRR